MREGAKRRLIGAASLVLLAVIFVPMLVEEEALEPMPEPTIEISAEPEFDKEFTPTEVFLEPGEVPLAEEFEYQSEADHEYADESASERVLIPTVEPASKESPARPEPVAVAPGDTPVASAVGAAPLDGPGWVVQVASLSSASNAAGHEKKLRGIGFPAFIEKADVGGRTWYRVRVGPETKRGAANALAARLKQHGYPDAFVKSYP